MEERCGACGKPLAIFIGPPAPIPRKIGLGPLMVLIAVVAVCMAVGRVFLPLGILMGLVIPPAMARTHIASVRRDADGRPLSGAARFELFVASTCIVGFLVFVAAIVSVMAAGFGGMNGALLGSFIGIHAQGPAAVFVGTASALVATGAVMMAIGRPLWKIPD